MPKSVHIRIAEPCHQNWNEMTPTQQGAFCHSCKKNVIDFTRKTENEIYDLVTQPGAQLCGRFTQFQLQQPVRKTEVKNGLFNWRAIAASLAGLLAFGKQANAGDLENKPKADTSALTDKTDTSFVANKDLQVTVATPKTFKVSNERVGMLVAQENPPVITDTNQHRLKGRVIDAENKEPIGYASVVVNGTKTGALTDEDGYFDFAVDKEQHKNDTLTINFIGYERKEIAIAELKPGIPIALEVRNNMNMVGLLVVTVNNPLSDEFGGYNDLTPWFERHKARRINRGR